MFNSSMNGSHVTETFTLTFTVQHMEIASADEMWDQRVFLDVSYLGMKTGTTLISSQKDFCGNEGVQSSVEKTTPPQNTDGVCKPLLSRSHFLTLRIVYLVSTSVIYILR